MRYILQDINEPQYYYESFGTLGAIFTKFLSKAKRFKNVKELAWSRYLIKPIKTKIIKLGI